MVSKKSFLIACCLTPRFDMKVPSWEFAGHDLKEEQGKEEIKME